MTYKTRIDKLITLAPLGYVETKVLTVIVPTDAFDKDGVCHVSLKDCDIPEDSRNEKLPLRAMIDISGTSQSFSGSIVFTS